MPRATVYGPCKSPNNGECVKCMYCIFSAVVSACHVYDSCCMSCTQSVTAYNYFTIIELKKWKNMQGEIRIRSHRCIKSKAESMLPV
jgi:hypothetical protein